MREKGHEGMLKAAIVVLKHASDGQAIKRACVEVEFGLRAFRMWKA